MDTHTPGPWATMIDSTKEYIAVYAKVGQVTKVICPVKIGDTANAQLIAAAPELLEACRAGGRYSDALRAYQDRGVRGTMVDGTDDLDRLFMDWHDKAHAAVAKADGRS